MWRSVPFASKTRSRSRSERSGRGSAQFLPHVFDHFRQADSTSTRTQRDLVWDWLSSVTLCSARWPVRPRSAGAARGATFPLSLSAPALQSAPAPVDLEPLGCSRGPACSMAHAEIRVYASSWSMTPATLEMLVSCWRSATPRSAPANRLWCAGDHPAMAARPAGSDIAMPEHDGLWLIAQVRALEGTGQCPLACTRPDRLCESRGPGTCIEAGFTMFAQAHRTGRVGRDRGGLGTGDRPGVPSLEPPLLA